MDPELRQRILKAVCEHPAGDSVDTCAVIRLQETPDLRSAIHGVPFWGIAAGWDRAAGVRNHGEYALSQVRWYQKHSQAGVDSAPWEDLGRECFEATRKPSLAV